MWSDEVDDFSVVWGTNQMSRMDILVFDKMSDLV